MQAPNQETESPSLNEVLNRLLSIAQGSLTEGNKTRSSVCGKHVLTEAGALKAENDYQIVVSYARNPVSADEIIKFKRLLKEYSANHRKTGSGAALAAAGLVIFVIGVALLASSCVVPECLKNTTNMLLNCVQNTTNSTGMASACSSSSIPGGILIGIGSAATIAGGIIGFFYHNKTEINDTQSVLLNVQRTVTEKPSAAQWKELDNSGGTHIRLTTP